MERIHAVEKRFVARRCIHETAMKSALKAFNPVRVGDECKWVFATFWAVGPETITWQYAHNSYTNTYLNICLLPPTKLYLSNSPLSVYSTICLFVSMSICLVRRSLFLFLFVFLYLKLSYCPFVALNVAFIFPSVTLYKLLSVCPSVCVVDLDFLV